MTSSLDPMPCMHRRSLALPIVLLLAMASGTSAAARADDSDPSHTVSAPNGRLLAFQTEPAIVLRDGSRVTVTAAGTGCDVGTWRVRAPSAAGTGFAVVFRAFVAEVGPTVSNQGVKTCNLYVKLDSPTPRQFSLTRYRYTGYAQLQDGVAARHLTTYRFAGAAPASLPPASRSDRQLSGPHDKPFVVVDNLIGPSGALLTSGCFTSAMLNVNARLEVTTVDPSKGGYIQMDVAEGLQNELNLEVASRDCVPAP